MPYKLNDQCIVSWQDGTMYIGRIQKILDPETQTINECTGRQATVQNPVTRSFLSLKKDKTHRIPRIVMDECSAANKKRYYVHYRGWKEEFDEWVYDDRMMEYNVANITKMKDINAELKEKGGSKRKRVAEKQAKPELKEENPSKKVKVDEPEIEEVKQEPQTETKRVINPREIDIKNSEQIDLKLMFSLDLKRLLVKDWELVTKERMILKLPREITVTQIMREFYEEYKPVDDGENLNFLDFIASVMRYFDYTLGMMLLYRFERNQYYLVRPKQGEFIASEVYGAEHLLRLIVSMPTLLSQIDMDDKTLVYVMDMLNELTRYLDLNKVRYFNGESAYDSATRVYQAFSVPDMAGTAPRDESEEVDEMKY